MCIAEKVPDALAQLLYNLLNCAATASILVTWTQASFGSGISEQAIVSIQPVSIEWLNHESTIGIRLMGHACT
jgi:hypothetical protein